MQLGNCFNYTSLLGINILKKCDKWIQTFNMVNYTVTVTMRHLLHICQKKRVDKIAKIPR